MNHRSATTAPTKPMLDIVHKTFDRDGLQVEVGRFQSSRAFVPEGPWILAFRDRTSDEQNEYKSYPDEVAAMSDYDALERGEITADDVIWRRDLLASQKSGPRDRMM